MLVECMKPGDDGDGVAALRSHPRPRSLQPNTQYGQTWFLSFQRPPSDFRGDSSEIRGSVN